MRRRAEVLTDDLYRRLSGGEAELHARVAIPICTVNEDGAPHPAMLSYFEVAATDLHTLQLAVYNDSRTCANLRTRRVATLIVADAGLVCYVSGRVTETMQGMSSAPYNTIVTLRVTHAVFDEAPPDLEPGAFVTSGITYAARTGAALARARAVLAELRRVDSKDSN